MTNVVVKRWWWPAATVATASTAGVLLVLAEGAIGFRVVAGSQYVSFVAAHLTAIVMIAAALTARLSWRGMTTYVNRSNPFWEGIGYGLLVTVTSSAMFVIIDALRWGPAPGALSLGDFGAAILWSVALPILTFEMVVAALAGGLTWAVLSGRGGPPRPAQG